MTFTLPSMTAVLVLALVAAVAGVLIVAVGATGFLVRNHQIRVARHESIPTYYGRLVAAH